MKKQCEAIALATTYSKAHRCLKAGGGKKTGKRHLCTHHQIMEARRPL